MNQPWIDPVILSLGPLQVRWYGLMYVFAFLIGGAIVKYLAKKKFWPLPKEDIDKYVTWLIVGMFFGARLTYVFVYNWDYYSGNISDIFSVWKGGLSFHGAVIGMCLATWIFARVHKVHFLVITDCLALAGPPGLFLGRIGNYINGELYGRVTDSWVGVVFPGGGPFPRHASQLYEAFLEGVVLFVILFYVHKKQKFYGVTCSAFVFFYGLFRFFVEFFREPDQQLGYYAKYFTMGQILCGLMMLISIFMFWYAKRANITFASVQGSKADPLPSAELSKKR